MVRRSRKMVPRAKVNHLRGFLSGYFFNVPQRTGETEVLFA